MSDNIDVKFFKANNPGKRLGGGYITTGVFKLTFSVFKANNAFGFRVGLPSHQDSNGEWKNDVDFTSKEVSDRIHQIIAGHLNGGNYSNDMDNARTVTNLPSASSASPQRLGVPFARTQDTKAPF